jgi:putative ABC transport system permease protein
MMLGETIRTAWRSLTSNRMRTALTGLGMVIGVAAVVAVLSVGEGAQSQVEGRIRSLGSNLLTVRPESARGAVRSGSVQTLTIEDAEALRQIPGVAHISPEVSGNAQLRYREQNRSASVVGVMPDYLQVRALEIGQGLGISELDVRERQRVAVIGSTIAKELFPNESALGARMQIRGVAFRVVGILAEKGDSGFMSPDEMVLIPISTHQGSLFGQDHLSSIGIAVATEPEMALVQSAAEQLLRLRHKLRDDQENDFQIRSQTEMLATLNSVTGTFTALLGSVAAVSLLVGGIGIMNIMLVSVRERTREIGVRMAVGARRRDVLLQFLVEAVVVSLFGGILGLALGYGAATLIAKLGGWPTIVPSYAVMMSLAVSVSVGLLFGVGPARRAAKLDPVEALRQE